MSLERKLLDEFVPLATAHVSELERRPQGLLEWWSVMQHYGVPTRVLDWTPNPYKALHFAACSHEDQPGAIWMVHVSTVQAFMRKRHGSKSPPNPPGPTWYALELAPPQLFFGDPVQKSSRSEAQQGMFSWCRRFVSDHAPLIGDALVCEPEAESLFRKIVISGEIKAAMLAAIVGVEISDDTMFPDPDCGLAIAARKVVADNGL